jgi:hypothetical protein
MFLMQLPSRTEISLTAIDALTLLLDIACPIKLEVILFGPFFYFFNTILLLINGGAPDKLIPPSVVGLSTDLS